MPENYYKSVYTGKQIDDSLSRIINGELDEQVDAAKDSAAAAKVSEIAAKESETAAKKSETAAQAARTGAEAAAELSQIRAELAEDALEIAKQAKSFAVGGVTGWQSPGGMLVIPGLLHSPALPEGGTKNLSRIEIEAGYLYQVTLDSIPYIVEAKLDNEVFPDQVYEDGVIPITLVAGQVIAREYPEGDERGLVLENTGEAVWNLSLGSCIENTCNAAYFLRKASEAEVAAEQSQKDSALSAQNAQRQADEAEDQAALSKSYAVGHAGLEHISTDNLLAEVSIHIEGEGPASQPTQMFFRQEYRPKIGFLDGKTYGFAFGGKTYTIEAQKLSGSIGFGYVTRHEDVYIGERDDTDYTEFRVGISFAGKVDYIYPIAVYDGPAAIVPDNEDNARYYARQAHDISVRTPYVGPNGNWMVWDRGASAFVDSAVAARGPKGDQGDRGPAGPIGPEGPQGAIVDLETGIFGMELSPEGHLLVVVNDGQTPPPMEINDVGHLIYQINSGGTQNA